MIAPTVARPVHSYAPACTIVDRDVQVCVAQPPLPRPHPGSAGEIPATGFGGAVALLAAVVIVAGVLLWAWGRWSS